MVIPYDLPHLLMSGISESRFFVRDVEDGFWKKKYAKQHLSGFIDVVVK
ncbi:MAG: hypothetical protein ACI9ZV_000041 [Candidatus Azotimanducaceae bacterium]|jgi:hypothetical protein